MRTIWKGAIGFGLVSVPVKLYAATEEHSVQLHQVHMKDGGRIRMKRTCEVCEEQVDYADVAKGYQDDEGNTAVLTDADMAELPLPSKRLIDVLAFIDADRIDPVRLAGPYYISAESAAANKPYVLLREALKTTRQVAITKITLRTRESLALLRVHDDLLLLHTMYWPDEIRDAAGLAPPDSVAVRPQELKMASSLMDTLSEDFDLDSLHDEYRHALEELVAARLSSTTPAKKKDTAAAPDNVIDLMAALQASIDARSGGDEGEGGATPRKRASKSRARKSAASGSTASGTKDASPRKSSPAKKTAKKSTAATSATESGGKRTGTAGSKSGTAAKKTAASAKKTTAGKAAASKRGRASA
ncbi:non-homologous end joining protein Ku [Streptomyces sp. H27-D2]|uniref:non-homologous end joining protein Ku n=1 Tax=Streptomyces sp. H27-D2 TaxID=3046304 RepID=UPI002DB67B8D|nr:Ku protein [Streptomyces sp. H27-D2]MEC4015492.1 Ku protein [Streptomyces sp. H27-D2]